MTRFTKRPLEFYGKFVGEGRGKKRLLRAIRQEHCPFLDKRCVKIRKSSPRLTIGACTVGYRGVPLVICPHRFIRRNQVFLDCVRLLRPRLHYWTVPEIRMPGGSVDYFLVGTGDGKIMDFAGVEIQSVDTTGTGEVWKARRELLRGRLRSSYGYGINWKMSAKTILVQLLHKAASFEALDKRLVVVVQREFYEYVTKEFDAVRLRDADDRDAIHFHVYDVVSMGGGLEVVLAHRKSTDARGVERMLRPRRTLEIAEEEVIARIRSKMANAKRLRIPTA